MKLKKETINGVDYVRKDVLVRLFDEVYKGCLEDADKNGKFLQYINAGAMKELRDIFQIL